jgi:hypothetical protein
MISVEFKKRLKEKRMLAHHVLVISKTTVQQSSVITGHTTSFEVLNYL